MSLYDAIDFVNSYLPGIIVWMILTYLSHRKFNAILSLFEVILFSNIISLIEAYLVSWNAYLIAIVFGILLFLTLNSNILLRCCNSIGITSKIHQEGVWFSYVSQAQRMCYVHLIDGSIIYGYIAQYSSEDRSFLLGMPYYIKVGEEEGNRNWALNDVVANGIYFNDFSQIKLIEFEENSNEIKKRSNT